jgi:iron-sulfur cluster assembly protein
MPVTLTERAASRVRDFMSREEAAGLRLAVKPTGCSGYMYVVEMTKQVQDQDQVFESHGVPVVVDAHSLKYLEGTEVDFTREGLNEGFRFANPNVAATCGCGESFTV